MVKFSVFAVLVFATSEGVDAFLSPKPSVSAFRCARASQSTLEKTETAAPVSSLTTTVTSTVAGENSAQPEAEDVAAMTTTPEPGKKEKILKEPALWEYNFGLQDPRLPLPHGIIEELTPPEKYTITEETIRTLEEDGVVHIKGVFDEEWVEYLRKATAYQVDEPHFWAFAGTASKLYDYIQRNVWQTNKAFANFYYHSAMGHILAQCGRTDEVRVSTDLLMVNPNKGFFWHQDNQNGPITWEEGLRFWITMDETPKDYGAPVYLKSSHKNTVVEELDIWVDIEREGFEEYRDQQLEFRTKPGDMLIWNPRTVHKIDGPADGVWDSYRRVLGGTVAKGGSLYHDKRGTGGVLSDLGRHTLVDGDKLSSPFFPIIYPAFDKTEAKARNKGKVQRSPKDIVSKLSDFATKESFSKFQSFFKVLGSRR